MNEIEELTKDIDKILFTLQDVRDAVTGLGSHEFLGNVLRALNDANRNLIAFHQVMTNES